MGSQFTWRDAESPLFVSKLFLIFGLLLGIPYALWMGPLGVPDEGAHIYRAFTTSRGVCIAPPAVAAHADWRDLAHQTTWSQLPPHTSPQDFTRLIKSPQFASGETGLFTIVNLYSCVPYLATGFAFQVGGWTTSSWLTLMYLGRIANLLVFLALAYAALRLLPAFHLVVASIALMPMTLHQAASLSTDSIAFAFAFLWTAFLLRLSLDPKPAPLNTVEHRMLLAGIVIGALIKANAGLAFLTLLLPGAKFPSRRRRVLHVVGYIVLAYGITFLWEYLNSTNWAIFLIARSALGINISDNLSTILHHPLGWLAAVARTLVYFRSEYADEFVGKLGWLTVSLPAWLVWTYVALLLVIALTQRSAVRLSLWFRFVLIGVFVFNTLSLFALASAWNTEGHHLLSDIISGNAIIAGVQGRYLIPFAPLLFIAISGVEIRVPRQYLAPAFLAFLLVAHIATLRLVWNTYQAHTSILNNRIGMALNLLFRDNPETSALRYDQRLIQRRGFADQRVYLVSGGAKHHLLDKDWMARHSYRWPLDILIVSGEELDAIPTGQPVIPGGNALLWVHDSAAHNLQADGPRELSFSPETFHVRFVATPTQTVRIHLHMKPGAGSVIWNQVRLLDSHGQSIATLKNADFTDASIAPWMYYGNVKWKLLSPATDSSAGIEESVGEGGVCQDVGGLIPGKTYDITAVARWLPQ